MANSYVVELEFLSNTNEVITLSIPRADGNIDPLDAYDNMEALISCGIVMTGSGKPAQVKSLTLVTTDVSTLNLA